MPVDDSAERTLLLSRLTGQRHHVISQLDGLTDEQLRRPVLPSGWSCLGLVRHLTLSDERYWFEVVVAGEPLDFWPEGDNGDWRVDPKEPSEAVLEAYRSAIGRSNEIITARGLAGAAGGLVGVGRASVPRPAHRTGARACRDRHSCRPLGRHPGTARRTPVPRAVSHERPRTGIH